MAFTTDIKTRRKARIFVDVMKNGGTMTEAGMKIWPNQGAEVAHVSMSQDLQKHTVRRTIMEIMEAEGLTEDFVVREHTKVLKQDEHLSAKNVAIDMAYKIRGSYAPDRSINVNLDIPTDEKSINEAILALQKELKEAE